MNNAVSAAKLTNFLCIISEKLWFSPEHNWFLLIQPWTLLAQRLYMFAQKHRKNIAINFCIVFFPICTAYFSIFWTVFCSSNKFSDMESKRNTYFSKNHILRLFKKKHCKLYWIFRFLVYLASIMKNNAFSAVSMAFACLLVAINVQHWIRDVQKCFSWISYDQRCQN